MVDLVVIGIALATAVLNYSSTRTHTKPLNEFVAAAKTNKETVETLRSTFENATNNQNANVNQTLEIMKDQNRLHSESMRDSIKALQQTADRITTVMGVMIDRIR